MSDRYILEGKTVVLTDDLYKWAAWFENADRIVKQEELENGKYISTVFLGLDHNFGSGPPLLFETMVFSEDEGDELDCQRYPTWDEAVKGHEEMVSKWQRTDNEQEGGTQE